jgi:uncharacterized membrane protein YfcA
LTVACEPAADNRPTDDNDVRPVGRGLDALSRGAGIVGFAKTAVGSSGALAAAAFALALPATVSTGALFPLLLVGDLIAVRVYHRHADWAVLLRLLPGVLPGLVLGAWFVSVADDTVMRRTIGAVLLVMCLLTLRPRTPGKRPPVLGTVVMGGASGFATMTAYAAGPVTTIYLLIAELPKMSFLGTTSWFFLVVNAVKLPFSAGLDSSPPTASVPGALLVPALAAGAMVGVAWIQRIQQEQFERTALVQTVVAAIALLV